MIHNIKLVHRFGPPFGPTPHNFSTIFKLKHMLALNVSTLSWIAGIGIRYGSQGLEHTVLATLPPILQSHSTKLMTLQD
ncbi:palmitoyl-acyl carrier protein thioesterase, chloroplastic [Trifolium repens]|nr:palmitoyl-acyl carrier protein thioesterase, chloroplastic [Trifolium repens]